jgi:hypothetical protein
MSSMRDEGAHVLEWLAYHRVIGFPDAVICTNDCSDGSDILLDRLADARLLTHLRNEVPPGTPPQHAAARLAMAHLAEADAGWVLHIDADEFLNVRLGAGHADDLLALADHADCIALAWRNYGDSGHATWPGATLPHFTRREAQPAPDETYIKCLFRRPAFAAAWAHMPAQPTGQPRLVNAAGEPLAADNLFSDRPRVRFFPVARADRAETHAGINHYGVKSPDLFALKRARGRGENTTGHQKYRLDSEWHRRANRNDVEDRAILRHWPATQAELDRLRALPGVAEAEKTCLAWLDARREKARHDD